MPPDPVKVTLPIPGTAAESDADRGEVLLSRSRYYRLDVDTVDKNVLVTVSRRWLYKDGFPAGLIAAIRKHPEVKQTDSRLFDSRDGKIEASQYIRWDPAESGRRAAALLLYVACVPLFIVWLTVRHKAHLGDPAYQVMCGVV